MVSAPRSSERPARRARAAVQVAPGLPWWSRVGLALFAACALAASFVAFGAPFWLSAAIGALAALRLAVPV